MDTFLLVAIFTAAGASEELSLKRPQGIAYDRRDHLFVADTGNHRALELDAGLRLVRVFGTGKAGREPGQLDGPMDVAVPEHGSFIIVADTGNDRIVLFLPDGRFLRAFGERGADPGQFNRPSNLTLDERGRLIVTDRLNHRLQVLEPTGRSVAVLGNRTGPRSSSDIDGLLAFFRALGQPCERKMFDGHWETGDLGQLKEPGQVFYDRGLQRLFVADGRNGRIVTLDYDSKTGTVSRRGPRTGIAVRGLAGAYGCVGTPDGGLVVSQSDSWVIRRYLDAATLDCARRPEERLEPDLYGGVRGFTELAVAPRSGVVAAVDTRAGRIVIFGKDLRMPEPPRVTAVTDRGATITYATLAPAPTRIQLRESPYSLVVDPPEGSEALGVPRTVTVDETSTREHTITLAELRPGTRCYYRLFMPGLRAVPQDGWTREYAINTLAPPGRKSLIRVPVRVLLIANAIDPEGVIGNDEPVAGVPQGQEAGIAPQPVPMSAEEIQRCYMRSFGETQLFYWINSHLDYWLDFDLFVDHTMCRTTRAPEGAPAWLRDLPPVDVARSWRNALADATEEQTLYYGDVVCTAVRRWNTGRQEWLYKAGGGSTSGIAELDDRTYGVAGFQGGGDVAWLFTHEFKHQMERMYRLSGLVREDDRNWSCHLAPKHDDPSTPWVDWPWDTAADHGEHWDGIAWQLRHLTRDQHLRSYWGELVTAADVDGDGVPDAAPELPFDEQRFGSDPENTDTDLDGLSDLEELLASTWVTAPLSPVRKRVAVPYVRPDPARADSDRDDVIDGLDPYPIYPYSTTIPRGTIRIDGGLADWKAAQTITFRHEGLGPEGKSIDLVIRSCFSEGWLYYSLAFETKHAGADLWIDADADGILRGKDNVHLRISPRGVLRTVEVRRCENNRSPYKDDKVLRLKDVMHAAKSLGSHQEIELALPRRPDLGLELIPGEKLGLQVFVDLRGGARVSVFEPYAIFDSELASN